MEIFFTLEFKDCKKENNSLNFKKHFVVCWFLIFLFYIPILLAFYPGIVTYDVSDQLGQILNGTYNLKHPFAHTMFMGIIFKNIYNITHDWNKAAFFHSLTQMLIMTGTFSYICIWIYKFSESKILFVMTLMFFSILPIHPLFAMVTTKDVLFSAFVAILFIQLLEIGNSNTLEKTYTIIKLSLLFFLIFIFRNNALYAALLFLPIALVCYKRKQIALSIGIAIVLLFSYNFFLHNYIHASNGPKAEMYSVPIQQMARVYNLHGDELPELEKKDLETLIWNGKDTLLKYESRKSDAVKDGLIQEVLEENKSKYAKLWLLWGLKYPTVYLDAWMNLINGYFCFDDPLPDKQTYRTYIEIRCDAYNEMDLHFSSKNHKLFTLYDSLFRGATCQNIPILSIICQLAFYDWTLILVFAYCLAQKQYSWLPPLAILLGIFATNLLGPVAILRYIYPFVICFPLILGIFIKCATITGKTQKG